ncbi:MAG: hypothetical protein WC558_04160 [Patulibacter sp.]
MDRALPTSLALLLALAVPATAQAQTAGATPARGKAVLVATEKGISTASFLANRRLDVTITYKRRSSSASTVRLAARFKSGKRCPTRPSSADRRRLGMATRQGVRSSYFAATGWARFGSGVNRVCIWAQEGSGSYRRLAMQRPVFARSLFGATAVEGTHVGLAVTAAHIASSAPITGNRVVEGIGGRGGTCKLEDSPLTSLAQAGIQVSSFSHATGAACTRIAVNAASTAGSASLAAGPTAVGAPTRVVQHVGDCNPGVTRSVPVPRVDAATFLAAAGCKLGRVISGTSENRKRAGLPPAGDIYQVLYRGKAVVLAPAGTTVDVMTDDRP